MGHARSCLLHPQFILRELVAPTSPTTARILRLVGRAMQNCTTRTAEVSCTRLATVNAVWWILIAATKYRRAPTRHGTHYTLDFGVGVDLCLLI